MHCMNHAAWHCSLMVQLHEGVVQKQTLPTSAPSLFIAPGLTTTTLVLLCHTQMASPGRGFLREALSSVAYEMRTWLRMMRPGSAYVAPYYPTPDSVIERMLELAHVDASTVLYDLGCGDGRVLCAAARRGAKGVGYELDPILVAQSLDNIKRHGYEDRLHVVRGDASHADVATATVIALYLSDHGNRKLLNAVRQTLRSGTKVVTFTFAVEGWEAHLQAVDRRDNLPVFVYHAPGGEEQPCATKKS